MFVIVIRVLVAADVGSVHIEHARQYLEEYPPSETRHLRLARRPEVDVERDDGREDGD